MNVTLILATVKFLSEHGDDLVAAGAEVASLWQFLRNHRDHPGLTDAQRAELELILAADPQTIGVGPVEVPTPVPPVGVAYQVVLDALPDVSLLQPGDRIFSTPDGKFYVTSGQFGANVPADYQLIFTA